jgi:hypothetical protein
VLVVMARRVASVCPRRAHARRERRPGHHGRELVSALSSSSSTRAVLGEARQCGGVLWRGGPRLASKGERGRLGMVMPWPAWPCHAI